MQQITEWRKKLALFECAQCFAKNRIDLYGLSDLADRRPKKLEISLGDRRKMLRSIRDLGSGSVAVTPPSTPVAIELTRQDGVERRQLARPCDRVGPAVFSVRFDPEQMRRIIGSYHKYVAETVARVNAFGGQATSAPACSLIWLSAAT